MDWSRPDPPLPLLPAPPPILCPSGCASGWPIPRRLSTLRRSPVHRRSELAPQDRFCPSAMAAHTSWLLLPLSPPSTTRESRTRHTAWRARRSGPRGLTRAVLLLRALLGQLPAGESRNGRQGVVDAGHRVGTATQATTP
ncbi:hypothetical protein ZWY2020_056136 [Hordeum vulgare]|nr:hypothetical protein ZWY2020_056136 [Hordeum vulgare]